MSLHSFRVGEEIKTTKLVPKVSIGTKGVITETFIVDQLYQVQFPGGIVRQLYPCEMTLHAANKTESLPAKKKPTTIKFFK